jgi:DNA polymerase-1
MMINIIIDCNYLCYVNRFSLSEGLTYRGSRTEIVFGFLKHLLILSEHFGTRDFFFCWDSRESRRREIYPKYKANRRPDDRPEEEKELDRIAFQQFDTIRLEVLPELGFRNIYIADGFEADDLIAKLVKKIEGTNIVVASDNDLYQLLSFCSLYNISKKQLTTKKEFVRKYGIEPEMWSEVKALSGCSGDNVSGIPGVGEKTAIKYLTGQLKGGKIFSKITESRDICDQNRLLVTLPFKDIPLPIYKRNSLLKDTFFGVFSTYGLSSLTQDKQFSRWIKNFELK